jgi:uncharacterized protein YacL
MFKRAQQLGLITSALGLVVVYSMASISRNALIALTKIEAPLYLAAAVLMLNGLWLPKWVQRQTHSTWRSLAAGGFSVLVSLIIAVSFGLFLALFLGSGPDANNLNKLVEIFFFYNLMSLLAGGIPAFVLGSLMGFALARRAKRERPLAL